RAGEVVGGVQSGDVGGELHVRQRAGDSRRLDRIRCRGDGLARQEQLMQGQVAVGAHADFQPSSVAIESAAAVVERYREESVAHGNGGGVQWAGNEVAAGT